LLQKLEDIRYLAESEGRVPVRCKARGLSGTDEGIARNDCVGSCDDPLHWPDFTLSLIVSSIPVSLSLSRDEAGSKPNIASALPDRAS
jgi:hypothetical protein